MVFAPKSEYRLRRRVQFHEVDSAGIVHFSWFFRYMEEAEHALWRDAGLSIAPPDAEVAFPRVSASFDFRSPLRFEEEFDVRIRIAGLSAKSLRYVCDVMRGDVHVATGTMTVTCVRRESGDVLKATAIPADIASRFAVAPALEQET